MGAGILLAVVGAILTFAVDNDLPGVNLRIVGVILMVAGAAVIAHSRRTTRRERVITRVDDTPDETPPHTVEHIIREEGID
jgi:membrane-bound ClpP family serine protease